MQGAQAARQLIITRGLDHALRRVAAAVARRAKSKVTGSGGLELVPCARSTPLLRCQGHSSKRAPGGRCLHVDCCAAVLRTGAVRHHSMCAEARATHLLSSSTLAARVYLPSRLPLLLVLALLRGATLQLVRRLWPAHPQLCFHWRPVRLLR